MKLKDNQTGIVRYIGKPFLSDHELIGIELDVWSPNAGDGTVRDEKIFTASEGRAYFARRTFIMYIIQLTDGLYARLQGLNRVPKFNDKLVKLMRYVEKKGRWKVQLIHDKQEKKYLGVRPENLNPQLNPNKLVVAEEPNIGDPFKIRDGRIGIVKYVGYVEFGTAFSKTIFVGLELEEWDPNGHNGTVKNRKYFDAKDGYGYFVKLMYLVESV